MDIKDVLLDIGSTLVNKDTSKAQQNAAGKTAAEVISALKELALEGKIDGTKFIESINGLKIEKDFSAYFGKTKKVEIKLGGSQK